MEKKIYGISIFGILIIVAEIANLIVPLGFGLYSYSLIQAFCLSKFVLYLLANRLVNFAVLRVAIFFAAKVLLISCGLGLIKKVKIARKAIIVFSVLTILASTMYIFQLFNASQGFHAYMVRELLVGWSFPIILIFFLTRPKIKEQFK